MACTDCKQSIFDDTPSQIPAPLCVDGCPEDVNCGDLAIASKCVYVNVALPCSETVVNQDLTTALQALDAKVCTITDAACQVKIDANDCCGYLEDKLTAGSGITITKGDVGRDCNDLTIALDCPTWDSASLVPKFYNIPTFQTVQYRKSGCSVRITGAVLNGTYSAIAPKIFTLPAGYIPATKKVFNAFAFISGAQKVMHGLITIETTGDVKFTALDAPATLNVDIKVLPLEITFETN